MYGNNRKTQMAVADSVTEKSQAQAQITNLRKIASHKDVKRKTKQTIVATETMFEHTTFAVIATLRALN